MNTFEEKVKKYIESNEMLNAGDGLVIGLSGGADSVCLLLVICQLADYFDIDRKKLVAVHINHMIRGNEACEDQSFAEELCKKLGVSFRAFSEDIPAFAKANGYSVEEAGRIFRYKCFNDVCSWLGNSKIAVAHNKNDVAETVLFNITRGSGLMGLKGISPKRDNIIRPILNCTRAEIEEYLSKKKQAYREDSTNACTEYDRNKIRHTVLPALLEINNKAVEHIFDMAAEAEKSHNFIREKAVENMEAALLDTEGTKTISLDIEELYKSSPVLQEHIVREAVTNAAGSRKDITRSHIMSVVDLIYQDTGKMVQLPYGIIARKSYDKLVIGANNLENEKYCIDISCEGNYKIPGLGEMCVRFSKWEPGNEPSKKVYTKIADYGKITNNFCIRTPMDGDYIVIDAKGNTKKINRVFIDNKIDREKRLSWPVVACGNEIIWVVGLRFSEAYKVFDNTKEIVCLDYKLYSGGND